MTTQFRMHNGIWHIASTEAYTVGTRVTVTRRNGAASDCIIVARVAHDPARELPYTYSFNDARRAAGATPTTERDTVSGAAILFDMFERAQRSVNTMANQASREPRGVAVRFHLNNTQRGLRIEPASSSSHRHAGTLVCLSNDARRTLWGTLNRDGVYQARVGATEIERIIHEEILSTLRSFAASPSRRAASEGRMTGNCCFCGRGLTDTRSVAVGYGPVCAEYYGLPWGDSPPPDFDLSQGPTRQRERLADNAGRENNFDTLASLAEAMSQPIATESFRIQAGEQLSVGDFVYRDTDGRWRRTTRGEAQAAVHSIRSEVAGGSFVQYVEAMRFNRGATATEAAAARDAIVQAEPALRVAGEFEGVPTLEDIENEPNAMRRMAMAANRASAGLPTVQRNWRGEIINQTQAGIAQAMGEALDAWGRQFGVERASYNGTPESDDRYRMRILEAQRTVGESAGSPNVQTYRRQPQTIPTRPLRGIRPPLLGSSPAVPTNETTTQTVRRARPSEPVEIGEEDFIWPPRN